MRRKSLQNIFCKMAAAALSISLLVPPVPLWAAEGANGGVGPVSEEGGLKRYDSIKGLAEEALYDTDGQPVMANGGEVHQVQENGRAKWYWFGEDTPGAYTDAARAVHLYSSTDLYNWTREEDMFRGMSSKEEFDTDEYFKGLYGDLSDSEKDVVFECLKDCPTAHPRVVYNEKGKQYVMWVPASGPSGKTCIATSSNVQGPYKFIKYCEGVTMLGTLFQDSDGAAYAFYQGADGFSMVELTDDYMDVKEGTAKLVAFGGEALFTHEAAVFQRDGKYYIVNSGTSQYAMADSLDGTWTVHPFKLNGEGGASTDTSSGLDSINPSSCIFQVKAKEGSAYIHMTEWWDMMREGLPRYVWLPVVFSEDGAIALDGLSNWKLEVEKEEEPPVEAEEVTLLETARTMEVGETYQIKATVLPEEAENKELSYVSSDGTVAEVDGAGVVTAKKAGKAEITVSTANGKAAKLELTVEEAKEPPEEDTGKPPEEDTGKPPEGDTGKPPEEDTEKPPEEGTGKPPVEVKKIKLFETSKAMRVGERYQIEVSVLPVQAANKKLTYVSSDDTVAEVSATGQVAAKKAGSAEVTVSSANGKTAKFQVTVEAVEQPPIEVTEVKLPIASKTMKVGETYQMETVVLPADAANKELAYRSNDSSVAEVSATGKVTAKKAGTAAVTVSSANGKMARLQLTVKEKKTEVQKVLVSVGKMTVGVGEEVQIEAGVYPKGASNKKLTYKPSNSKVKVDKSGKLTAKKTGTCKVTVSASNGKKAVVRVTVKKKPEKVTLNAKKKDLPPGKKFQIKPKLPKGTASYKITYTSNKKSVASVSKTGKVAAKKKGDAIITAKTYNGKKAQLKVHVE